MSQTIEYDYEHSDRNELLDEIDKLNEPEEGLGIKTLLKALGALFLVLGLAIPKIYISSNIYYMSLETDSLLASYKSLQEENGYLSQKLEEIRYKNSVLSSLGDERNKTVR